MLKPLSKLWLGAQARATAAQQTAARHVAPELSAAKPTRRSLAAGRATLGPPHRRRDGRPNYSQQRVPIARTIGSARGQVQQRRMRERACVSRVQRLGSRLAVCGGWCGCITHLLELLGGPLEPLPPSRRHRSRFGPNWSAPAVEPTTTPAKRCCARGRRWARMPRARARGFVTGGDGGSGARSTWHVHSRRVLNNLTLDPCVQNFASLPCITLHAYIAQ